MLRQEGFNSYKVRLKGSMIFVKDAQLGCFNSYKVRLKVLPISPRNIIFCKFQFLQG